MQAVGRSASYCLGWQFMAKHHYRSVAPYPGYKMRNPVSEMFQASADLLLWPNLHNAFVILDISLYYKFGTRTLPGTSNMQIAHVIVARRYDICSFVSITRRHAEPQHGQSIDLVANSYSWVLAWTRFPPVTLLSVFDGSLLVSLGDSPQPDCRYIDVNDLWFL
jgi:hypothetical protein